MAPPRVALSCRPVHDPLRTARASELYERSRGRSCGRPATSGSQRQGSARSVRQLLTASIFKLSRAERRDTGRRSPRRVVSQLDRDVVQALQTLRDDVEEGHQFVLVADWPGGGIEIGRAKV